MYSNGGDLVNVTTQIIYILPEEREGGMSYIECDVLYLDT